MVTNFCCNPAIHDIRTCKKNRIESRPTRSFRWNNFYGQHCGEEFSNESKFIECVSSVVEEQHKEAVTVLRTQLSVILRISNCDRKIHTNELGKPCKSTYLLILESFPWANITPTLHKLLAHSEELREINFGYGFKCFSEEGSETCNKLIWNRNI